MNFQIEKIYEDEFYVIEHSLEYRYIPGFFVIFQKKDIPQECGKAIKRLAVLEKNIRDELLKNGADLVGIYHESSDGLMKIYIIPYYVNVLNRLNISPDLYQPYIDRYLNSFEMDDLERTQEVNKRVREILLKEEF